mmetsp:Transcript_8158/g.13981  ORF Transcript_8158/g.13981 Transcript_8158/m.13981 type:complete len:88 (+) Transcript_8158:354-617(+)
MHAHSTAPDTASRSRCGKAEAGFYKRCQSCCDLNSEYQRRFQKGRDSIRRLKTAQAEKAEALDVEMTGLKCRLSSDEMQRSDARRFV